MCAESREGWTDSMVVDAMLGLVVESVVVRCHVAEQGVATDGRNLDGVQDQGTSFAPQVVAPVPQ